MLNFKSLRFVASASRSLMRFLAILLPALTRWLLIVAPSYPVARRVLDAVYLVLWGSIARCIAESLTVVGDFVFDAVNPIVDHVAPPFIKSTSSPARALEDSPNYYHQDPVANSLIIAANTDKRTASVDMLDLGIGGKQRRSNHDVSQCPFTRAS